VKLKKPIPLTPKKPSNFLSKNQKSNIIMKKFLFSLFLMAFAMCAYTDISAQKIFTMTNSGSTVTNAGVVNLTLPIREGFDTAVFGLRITKTSGTVAGTSVLEQSMDNTNWETATGTDTLSHSNVTTNIKNWALTNPAFPYYRIKVTGSGTMAATATGWLHVKSISK
jgi:hypothetical protein